MTNDGKSRLLKGLRKGGLAKESIIHSWVFLLPLSTFPPLGSHLRGNLVVYGGSRARPLNPNPKPHSRTENLKPRPYNPITLQPKTQDTTLDPRPKTLNLETGRKMALSSLLATSRCGDLGGSFPTPKHPARTPKPQTSHSPYSGLGFRAQGPLHSKHPKIPIRV